jgi:hypothetical protein
MIWIVAVVLIVVVIALFTVGAHRAKDADDEIRDMNRDHEGGPGNGILGVFGKTRKRR